MIIGKVVGTVVSTRKCDNLIGSKFMIVEPIPSLKVENREGGGLKVTMEKSLRGKI